MPKKFLVHGRAKYICGCCGLEVLGGRYHNHCPHCLWSRHLDEAVPGDRASGCKGMMEPIEAFLESGRWRIRHQCEECGKRMVIDMATDDDFNKVIELSLMAVK